MQEIRCVKCNRLLMKSNGNGADGLIFEVKCPKCGFVGSYHLGQFTLDQLQHKNQQGITILSVHK